MSDPDDLASRHPCVMLSSTFYDLRQVRDDLRRFIETDLGYRALVSEHPSFPIDPDVTTVENCRRRVEHDADLMVLIIGRRYGTIDKRSASSVTNLEYTTARHKGIPIYAFVEAGIVGLLSVWRANPDGDFSAEVDSAKLFEFVDQVRTTDSVWMQEFKDANEIVTALRTQFSYQQFRGLRFQRQLRRSGDRDWFSSLRGRALRIALDRPPMWEYLLFGAALTDSVDQHRRLARRHELGLPVGLGEDVREPLQWIRSRFNDAQRLAATLNTIFADPLQGALGPPGQPGDAEALSFLAETIGDLYRDALTWVVRLRTANVDDDFRPLVDAVAGMLDQMIDSISAFGPYVTRTVEDAVAAPQTGEVRVINMTLTISVPETAMALFEEQLSRLGGLHGV